MVAANNQKLYVNRSDGFVGFGLKKDEFVCECSDLDDIIVFRKDGRFKVSRIADKVFMGKDILHVGVFNKNDERMVYNLIYLEGKTGKSLVKRFHVLGVTRDREYDLTKGQKGSKILYLTANPNGEAETVTVNLTAGCKARKKISDFDFSSIDIKGRNAQGNILTKYPVRKIQLKAAGISTLGGLDIWYDPTIGRLNRDSRGKFLGNFMPEDQILVMTRDGQYALTGFDLTNRYEAEKIVLIDKFKMDDVIGAIYYHGGNKTFYVKRFQIETLSTDKKFLFISEDKGSHLEVATNRKDQKIRVYYNVKRKDAKKSQEFIIDDLIEVKGWKALGNKVSVHKIKKIELLNGEEIKQKGSKKEASKPSERLIEILKNPPDDEETTEAKVEKIKSVQKRGARYKETGNADTTDLMSVDPSQTDNRSRISEQTAELHVKQIMGEKIVQNNDENEDSETDAQKEKEAIEKSPIDEIVEVGSTVDLNFEQPQKKNDQLGLFEE